jgi:hypothetical protein
MSTITLTKEQEKQFEVLVMDYGIVTDPGHSLSDENDLWELTEFADELGLQIAADAVLKEGEELIASSSFYHMNGNKKTVFLIKSKQMLKLISKIILVSDKFRYVEYFESDTKSNHRELKGYLIDALDVRVKCIKINKPHHQHDSVLVDHFDDTPYYPESIVNQAATLVFEISWLLILYNQKFIHEQEWIGGEFTELLKRDQTNVEILMALIMSIPDRGEDGHYWLVRLTNHLRNIADGYYSRRDCELCDTTDITTASGVVESLREEVIGKLKSIHLLSMTTAPAAVQSNINYRW